MIDSSLFSIVLAVTGSLLGILLAICAWAANRVYEKLCEMTETMKAFVADTSKLDKRITLVEAKCEMFHGGNFHAHRRAGDPECEEC